MAVGGPEIGANTQIYRVRQDLSQDRHIEGLPLGTRGGTLIRDNFPVDSEYQFGTFGGVPQAKLRADVYLPLGQNNGNLVGAQALSNE
jgi:hypothetical protein